MHTIETFKQEFNSFVVADCLNFILEIASMDTEGEKQRRMQVFRNTIIEMSARLLKVVDNNTPKPVK